jgi:CRISPR/Cas system Type II protein with McrA/HNH and RuvC-like nuclease domain
MSLSKKLRFEVFKRDGFKCQYCGSIPPNVILEVDHIIPVSKSGTDEIDNLITSCFDCNRGKSNRELTVLPKTTIEKTEELKERESQYAAYKKILAKVKKREKDELDSVDTIYSSYFPEWCLNDRFKNGSLKHGEKIY